MTEGNDNPRSIEDPMVQCHEEGEANRHLCVLAIKS